MIGGFLETVMVVYVENFEGIGQLYELITEISSNCRHF